MSIKTKIAEIRDRRPFVDHVMNMNEHYGLVGGGNLAGAVTYFGFLSFFPILALSFAVIGLVSQFYSGAEEDLIKAIDQVFPGLVGGDGGISLSSIRKAAPGIFSVGLLVVLYSGLGWLSSMRDALTAVFEKPVEEKPNFVIGKLRDVVTLATIGITLLLSVAITGVATGLSRRVVGWLGLSDALQPLLVALGVLVGLAANMLLFFTLFRLLAKPEAPAKALWQGALLGAVGFEVLKQLSTKLLASTKEQPAFQAFGIALILVIWINYFSRLVMYAASWAHTSEAARAQRLADEAARLQREARTRPWLIKSRTGPRRSLALARTSSFFVGSVSALGFADWLRRRRTAD